MARSTPSLSLGIALASLLGAGAVSAQSPTNNAAEVGSPHSTDNAKRPANTTPRAETEAQAQSAEKDNPDSVDNKDRVAEPGKGAGAADQAEAGSPHSVKNKDHHKMRHHHKKDGEAKPMAAPAATSEAPVPPPSK